MQAELPERIEELCLVVRALQDLHRRTASSLGWGLASVGTISVFGLAGTSIASVRNGESCILSR
jgi:hypothetical protein